MRSGEGLNGPCSTRGVYETEKRLTQKKRDEELGYKGSDKKKQF